MCTWIINYDANWDVYFNKLDKTIKEHILKKIAQLEKDRCARHFHKINFFILESNQYRIVFFENKETRVRTVAFVGNHTQYEEWYKSYY